jgi:allantoin racemase
MRVLLANPNTTEAVTELVARRAREVAPEGVEIRAVTGRFGAAVIGTRAELAVAEHAALDLLAREAPGCDAAIIAASTDSGLRAARSLLDMPVLGLTESALHVACLIAPCFATVTLSRASAGTLRELIALYGLGARCVAQRFADATPQELLAEPVRVAALVASEAFAAAEAGAECVVLVGAVTAELPARLQAAVPVPLVEGVSAAVALAPALARLRLPRPGGAFATPRGRATTGLDPALAGLLLRGFPP